VHSTVEARRDKSIEKSLKPAGGVDSSCSGTT
jgi:hypothetical protein